MQGEEEEKEEGFTWDCTDTKPRHISLHESLNRVQHPRGS